MRSIRLLPLVLLFACGDNDNHEHPKPDAGEPVDAPVDAPVPLTCAYTEMSDATNDDLFGPGTNTAEMTGLSVANAPFVICG